MRSELLGGCDEFGALGFVDDGYRPEKVVCAKPGGILEFLFLGIPGLVLESPEVFGEGESEVVIVESVDFVSVGHCGFG
jgi:hypothetical protein